MISKKCDKCKDKAWCWRCDECCVKVNPYHVLSVVKL